MDEPAAAFERRAQEAYDLDVDIRELPANLETVAERAQVLGCDPAQVARSQAFFADTLVVVVTSEENQVDTRTLATRRGVHDARVAEPESVEETLGWESSGLPPFCHDTDVPVYLDEALTAYDTVWATAGTSAAVFPIGPADIKRYADAEVLDIAM